MTSLEFIEKEIEKEQDIIKTYQECFKIDKTEFDKQITRGYIQIHQKNIVYLQQIKSELEAWYSIKQGVMICEDKVDEDSYYEYLQFDEELFDELESEEAGERLNPIKKALEVEE